MAAVIDPRERLIFALDVGSDEEAKALVEHLGDTVVFYKIGFQLLMTGNYFPLLEWLRLREKKVFFDLKLFDVPQTVSAAVAALADHEVSFVTVHGNDAMLRAAVAARKNVGILAVTALTSLDRSDLDDLGFAVDVKDLVLARARRALRIGCDGIVSSGLEAAAVRASEGGALIIVTPGVRPVSNTDDQKRTVDTSQAFRQGADYIVIGRPIRHHHGFANPRAAAAAVQRTITRLFPDA